MSTGEDSVWSDPSYWSEAAEQAFAKALRKGRREARADRRKGRRATLLSFDDVAGNLVRVPEGFESHATVFLRDIIGSVGKATLFTRSFYPLMPELRRRWKRAYAVVWGLRGYEPVELYEVDGVLYVVDGHFRISVARVLGHETIEATIRHWR